MQDNGGQKKTFIQNLATVKTAHKITVFLISFQVQ